MRVLFATAELSPLVKVGGLGDFSAGFTRALRSEDVDVEIALPDYGDLDLETTSSYQLEVPSWCAPASCRTADFEGTTLSLIHVPGISRPNPYVDSTGRAWTDNASRFIGFSAALAAWTTRMPPDILHLNDWHTTGALAFLPDPPPSLLTIHNLAYQGNTDQVWLDRLPFHSKLFGVHGEANPLAGGIVLADHVVAVSPNFVTETLPPNEGFGLARLLASRGTAYTGILNGIDTDIWDPSSDAHIGHNYDLSSLDIKDRIKRELANSLGMEVGDGPLVGMVTRLTDQKGVDIALDVLSTIVGEGGSMVLLGSGERELADAAADVASKHPGRFVFHNGYDERLSHLIFGGSDLYLMPSRFEPAGLTQMQAMRYGAIPVVTDVGGLHDTVVDADMRPDDGTGFVASSVSGSGVAEAMSRAAAAWRVKDRRRDIISRGMSIDWSWREPARAYLNLYQQIRSAR